jgi:hypothetical protein
MNNRSQPVQVGRLAGCLWLVMAGFGLLFIAGGGGVGIDASFVLMPLALIPLILTLVVFVAGQKPLVLAISVVCGLGYAALGVWNYFRAAAFEEANPGSMEVSVGPVSVAFVLLALAIALWSVGAAALARRRRGA